MWFSHAKSFEVETLKNTRKYIKQKNVSTWYHLHIDGYGTTNACRKFGVTLMRTLKGTKHDQTLHWGDNAAHPAATASDELS